MDNIIQLVLEYINSSECWFTTKADPTYMEPNNYYELDKYGELTDKSIKQIEKEVKDYVGNGAIDLDDAIDMWFNDNLCECKLDFKDNLKTKFEKKPVVDQIDAYEAKTESKLVENEVSKLSKGDIYKNKNGVIVKIIEVDTEHLMGGEPQVTYKFEGNTTDRTFYCYRMSSVISMLEQNGYELQDNRKIEKKIEGYKTRLREETIRSREELDKVLNADDFNPESNNGKMILRAQEVYNKLADLGYNMELSIDNGDVELDILLGQQGGKAIITLNANNQPIKAFATGNFELSDSNLEILSDINNQIKDI